MNFTNFFWGRVLLYIFIFLFEFLLIFLIFRTDFILDSHLKERRKYCLDRIDYNISKGNVKILILCIRDYISFGGDYKNLVLRRDGIEGVLKNSFITSDAYFLSKALVDDTVRAEFLKFSKVSNDFYIRYIASVYYYVLVSREIKEAIGDSYDQWKKNSSYKWLVELLDKPVLSFARNYIIGKLKDFSKTSSDNISVAISLSLLISLDYRDEGFYTSFLGTNSPVVFVISTVGLFITAQNNKKLNDYQKYSYFIFNKQDLYRYYSILLIMRFTDVFPDVYLNILNFDLIRDYKEISICLVMLLN